jgi:hypothetical protein
MKHIGDNIYTSVDSFIHCCTTGRKITSFVTGLKGDKSYNLLLTFRGLSQKAHLGHVGIMCNMVEMHRYALENT